MLAAELRVRRSHSPRVEIRHGGSGAGARVGAPGVLARAVHPAQSSFEGGVTMDFGRERTERRARHGQLLEQHKRLVPWKEVPTILLVEDDEDMRELLASVLRREGYRVVEAADGDGAVDWLGIGILEGDPERLPALIVSDICLPYMSGLDILEGARLSPWKLPVILITGFGDEDTHARASELGAVCVLDKPFSMHTLRTAVRSALQHRLRRPPGDRDGHLI